MSVILKFVGVYLEDHLALTTTTKKKNVLTEYRIPIGQFSHFFVLIIYEKLTLTFNLKPFCVLSVLEIPFPVRFVLVEISFILIKGVILFWVFLVI